MILSLQKEPGIHISYKKGQHVPSLDGIRGTAIIFVLLFHCYPYLSVFKFGWTGVDLFFVLSGFLISGILIDTVNDEHYYKNFILKRVLRIFPLYYLSLVIFLFLIPAFSPFISSILQLDYASLHQLWYWLYGSNWLLSLKDGWMHGAGINHFWSLSIEEQFYLFWPLLIALFRKKSFLTLCLSTIVLSMMVRIVLFFCNVSHPALYMLTITRADALALGGCIAVMIRNEAGIRVLSRIAPYMFFGMLLIIAVGVYLFGSINPYTNFFSSIGYTFVDMMYASLIVLGLSDFLFFRKLLSTSVLRFFGKYSYSMYIFHHPVVIICFGLSGQLLPGGIWTRLLVSTLSILITILISLLTWNAFEAKFLRLKKKIR
jgi:peptidoglycan/LPS O-acetylase OafA/YrhL